MYDIRNKLAEKYNNLKPLYESLAEGKPVLSTVSFFTARIGKLTSKSFNNQHLDDLLVY
jgi:hypothetical protein